MARNFCSKVFQSRSLKSVDWSAHNFHGLFNMLILCGRKKECEKKFNDRGYFDCEIVFTNFLGAERVKREAFVVYVRL